MAVDIFDRPALVQALHGVDAVIHLAGLDLDADAAPGEYVHANALGTYCVLEAARDEGVRRVVTCSSITVTGLNEGRSDWMPLYLPVDEDHPLSPRHAYGISKRMAEAAALSFAAPGFDVIILRPMLVMFASNVGLVARRRAEQARWLYYYIAPEDAGRAFLAALEAPEGAGGVFFITAADSCHDEPTLDWLSRMVGERPTVRDHAYFDANPRASVFDGRRARDVLGFAPRSDWITLRKRLQEDAP